MKINNFLQKTATGLLAAVLAFAPLAVSAEGVTYTGITGGTAVFEKYLIMENDANVPNVTFSFTIDPGTAASATGNSPRIFAGPSGASIGTAVFAQGQQTWPSAQAMSSDVTVKKDTNAKDAVTLQSGEKYARSNVTADFTHVTFNEPGVYRYVITESASSANGITNDAVTTRTLDVYVEDEVASGSSAHTLKITGYVLHNGSGMDTGKAEGFVNRYTTNNLTLSKVVEGNQASRDEYFEFTVSISNAVAGTVYDVDLDGADATTKINGINTTANSNSDSITVPAGETTVTQTYWLQGGQSIVIKGLAQGTGYSINENATTMANEGYSVAATVTSGQGTYTSNTLTTAGTLTADATVTYTNTKSGTVPTGVMTTVLPGVCIAVLGIAGFYFISKRRKDEELG